MAEDIDMLELRAIRIGKEPSKAHPASYYRNPANTIRLEAEKNCAGCVYSMPGKSGEFCARGKKYGIRCDLFKGEKK